MSNLIANLLFFVVLLNLLSAVIIVIRSRGGGIHPANRYLAGFFFCVFLYGVASYVFDFERTPIYMALVYGHFASFYYLIGPFCYFYVRGVLTGDAGFRRMDWLHALPALIQTVNLSRYLFFTPFEEKLALAARMYVDVDVVTNSGIGLFIPVHVNYLLRPAIAILYALASLAMVRAWIRTSTGPNDGYPSLKNWLHWFLGIQLWMYTAYLTIFILDTVTGLSLRWLLDDSMLMPISFFAYLLLSIIPHFYPHILFGFVNSPRPWPAGAGPLATADAPDSLGAATPSGMTPSSSATDRIYAAASDGDFHAASTQTTRRIPSEQGDILSTDRLHEIDMRLDAYLNESKPFCDPDFSIKSMSQAAGIPAYQIHYYLRYFKQVRFIDYRMRLRMAHARTLLEQGESQTLTIQAIAEKCGYTNRGTFIEHFKKMYGMSPSEFISGEV